MLSVFIYGHSSTLVSGKVFVFPRVFCVPSVPCRKIFDFPSGCVVMVASYLQPQVMILYGVLCLKGSMGWGRLCGGAYNHLSAANIHPTIGGYLDDSERSQPL